MIELMEKEESHESERVKTDDGQMVIFKLGNEEFGIDINNVKEIVRLPEVVPVPQSPSYVAGICNLRGNVLPVIDTRSRFSMEHVNVTEDSRLLVIEAKGISCGLIVDNLREVMRMDSTSIEPPPAITQSVGRQFLSGVVKVNEGKRLILVLKIDEVIHIDMLKKEKKSEGVKAEKTESRKELINEEQLVSFRIAKEEYAFSINRVREILKIKEITSVPNVADYVKGLFTVRNQLIPMVDLRVLLGIRDLISERSALIESMMEEEKAHYDSVKKSIESGLRNSDMRDAKTTHFMKWLEQYNTSSTEIENVLKKIKKPYAALYQGMAHALELCRISKEEGQTFFDSEITPQINTIFEYFTMLKESIEKFGTEDQRVMIVETDGVSIGFMVDDVNEVARIPKSVIDETPKIASSSRKELRGVAKLDEGKRLIMILDESALLSESEKGALSELASAEEKKKSGDGEEKSLKCQEMDEEQLVTFSIDTHEYGVRIMEVQEINRLSEITTVPRAPSFIDGVTNLRGNVIPVINVRRLFGKEEKDIDDKTRIIIVDIDGVKSGWRVDQVNEVLRLSKAHIEEAPSVVVSDGENDFIEGICKLNDGKRMVLFINVKKILGTKDLKSLASLEKTVMKMEDESVEETHEVHSSQNKPEKSKKKESSR